MEWIYLGDSKPEEFVSINGIEMPYEARYSCHREGLDYYSDETGNKVLITHWQQASDPPNASRELDKTQ